MVVNVKTGTWELSVKVKNVKDSVFFPIGMILPDDETTIIRAEGMEDEDYKAHQGRVIGMMNEYSTAKHAAQTAPTDIPHDVETLRAFINPARLATYELYGAELPSDLVKCSVSIGSLIFDLFNLCAPRERAPLAQALQRREVDSLAKWTKRDAFEIAPSLLKVIRPGVEKEELWKELRLSLEIETPGGAKYTQVTVAMANHFPNIVHATVALFLPPEKEALRAVGSKKS